MSITVELIQNKILSILDVQIDYSMYTTEYSKNRGGGGGGIQIEDLYEVIRRQIHASRRPINNFVQVLIGPQVTAIVHSNY